MSPATRARVALYVGAFATSATAHGASGIEIDMGEHQVLVGVIDAAVARCSRRKIVGHAAIVESPDAAALGRTHAIALCEALGVQP